MHQQNGKQNSYYMEKEKYQHLTDEELIQLFNKERDNQWLGILLQRYTLLLLGVCMKYLKNEMQAQDAVQQIFIKTIVELEKYKVSYFKSWLYIVAKNFCLQQLRHVHLQVPITENLDIESEEVDKSFFENNEQLLSLMEQNIPKLNDEQKRCIVLFYFEKKTYQDICSITDFTPLQVKSYIQNGKRNLKNLIEKQIKE